MPGLDVAAADRLLTTTRSVRRRLDLGSRRAAAFYGSIHPAIWSFMLALRVRGFGSVYTSLHLVHEREAAELLGIPDHVTQVGLVPVAPFLGEDFRPADRGPVDEITSIDGWGTDGSGVDD